MGLLVDERGDETYPEQSEEDGGCHVPLCVQEVSKPSEEDRIPHALPDICIVSRVVESLSLELLVKRTVLEDNGLLRLGVDGWVVSPALFPLALLFTDGELVAMFLLLACGVVTGGGGVVGQRFWVINHLDGRGVSADAAVVTDELLAYQDGGLD